MKRIHFLSSAIALLGASSLGVGCQDSFKECENTRTCPRPGDGDGDTSTGGGDGDGDTGGGDGDGDGDTGGTGGIGTGGGDGDGDSTGGMGGDPNDPCLLCEADEYCTAEKECVGCLNDDHCDAPTPVCDPSSLTCVGCVDEMDCEDPALPLCDGNTCAAGCGGPADCERFEATPVCDEVSGECVGCLSADDCGGDVCARATHECVVGRTAHELSVCQVCEYDDDCQVGQLCVAQEFDGTAVGNFCTWRKDGRVATVSASCFSAGKPYAGQSAEPVASIEGQAAVLCVLRSTSCLAFLQHSQVAVGCSDETPTSDAACGASDVDDGLCRENTGGDPLCTYPCLSDEDCRTSSQCTVDGYCSL